MRSIRATMSVTLDGVVQGLGRPNEDTRGGFAHGEWGRGYQDDVMAEEMLKGMSRPGDMLLGRRTWQDTLEHASAWRNSVVLRGDAAHTVAELKARPGNDLSIIGSASLVRSLHAAYLIDHYTLLIYPLTLGSGMRLFDDAAPSIEFALTSSVTTTKGVIIAHYDRL